VHNTPTHQTTASPTKHEICKCRNVYRRPALENISVCITKRHTNYTSSSHLATQPIVSVNKLRATISKRHLNKDGALEANYRHPTKLKSFTISKGETKLSQFLLFLETGRWSSQPTLPTRSGINGYIVML